MKNTSRLATLRLPTETIDRILELALVPAPQFFTIASFALASRQFRLIAFRRYFLTFSESLLRRWQIMVPLIRSYAHHTRNLKSTVYILTTSPASLSLFSSLFSLTVDCSSEGLASQHDRFRLLFRFVPVFSSLARLKLTHVPRIGAPLLKSISSNFPALTHLSISSLERLDYTCCWSCFEESASTIRHSPIPEVYETAENLAHAFGKALLPLSRLQELSLGLLLSDEMLLYEHIHEHSEYDACFFSIDGCDELVHGMEDCTWCPLDAREETMRRERAATGILREHLVGLGKVIWGMQVSL